MIFIIKIFNNDIKVFPPNYSCKLPCHHFEKKKKKNQICDVKKILFICTILVVRGTLFGLEKNKNEKRKTHLRIVFCPLFFFKSYSNLRPFKIKHGSCRLGVLAAFVQKSNKIK